MFAHILEPCIYIHIFFLRELEAKEVAVATNRVKIDPNFIGSTVPVDDEAFYLYHVVVEQFDENEDTMTETIKSKIKLLIEDERPEAKKMLSTFGADDESEDSGRRGDAKTDKDSLKRKRGKQEAPKGKAKSTAKKSRGQKDTDDSGKTIDLTAKNLKADAMRSPQMFKALAGKPFDLLFV